MIRKSGYRFSVKIMLKSKKGKARRSRLLALAGEWKAAHRADAHLARHVVAGDLAGEGERQRHRVGDGDLPGDVVTGHGAVENLSRVALRALRARERSARAFQAQRGAALAHRRAHGEIPVSVDGHCSLLSVPVDRRAGWAEARICAPAYSASRAKAQSFCGSLQVPAAARAARMRLVTSRRNATYWMANAATLAPTRTTAK